MVFAVPVVLNAIVNFFAAKFILCYQDLFSYPWFMKNNILNIGNANENEKNNSNNNNDNNNSNNNNNNMTIVNR